MSAACSARTEDVEVEAADLGFMFLLGHLFGRIGNQADAGGTIETGCPRFCAEN